MCDWLNLILHKALMLMITLDHLVCIYKLQDMVLDCIKPCGLCYQVQDVVFDSYRPLFDLCYVVQDVVFHCFRPFGLCYEVLTPSTVQKYFMPIVVSSCFLSRRTCLLKSLCIISLDCLSISCV